MLKPLRILILAAFVGATAASAQNVLIQAIWVADNRWQEIVTDADAARLAKMPETRAAALREAQASPEFVSIAPLADAVTQPNAPEQLTGDWRCRTIKIGGLLPLTIYSYFDCTIRRDGDRLVIEKTTGSQRFTGELFASAIPGEFVYVGASNVGDEPPRIYGAGADHNQIGLLRQLGPDHLLLELPKPVFESNHDWIELVR